ncbi:hypothetical protein [Micromonospora sp. CPCC 205561]|uniref:hypothetical protein n=1 Tax=Micromonospora sp. CPCC 205561 TaxID=3122407 RepID=UPI002FF3A5D2
MSFVSVEISGDGAGGKVVIAGGGTGATPRAGIRIHGDPSGPGSTVNNGRTYGPVKAEMGELSDGDYGLAVVNEAGELVKLEDFIFGPKKAVMNTVGTTSSTTYANLSDGVGPVLNNVTIGETGRAIVTLTAYIEAPAGGTALMGVEIMRSDGSFAIAPDDLDSLSIGGGTTTGTVAVHGRSSVQVFVDGLFPGVYNFIPKYRTSRSSALFANRVITVQPY